ncbi:MAG: hypothetical protein R2856_08035 [Caldilineaceae bacterium]
MTVADVDSGETVSLQLQISNAAAGTIQRRRLHRSGLYWVTGLVSPTPTPPWTASPSRRQQHSHIRLIQHHLHGDGDRQPDRVRFVSPAPRVSPSSTARPVINDLAGDTLSYDEGDAATVIDPGTGATVVDGDAARLRHRHAHRRSPRAATAPRMSFRSATRAAAQLIGALRAV